MYEVALLRDAERFVKKAPRPLAKKIAKCLMQLEAGPHSHPNIKRLVGPWAGCLRYRIDETANRVQVLLIAHRGEVYR